MYFYFFKNQHKIIFNKILYIRQILIWKEKVFLQDKHHFLLFLYLFLKVLFILYSTVLTLLITSKTWLNNVCSKETLFNNKLFKRPDGLFFVSFILFLIIYPIPLLFVIHVAHIPFLFEIYSWRFSRSWDIRSTSLQISMARRVWSMQINICVSHCKRYERTMARILLQHILHGAETWQHEIWLIFDSILCCWKM